MVETRKNKDLKTHKIRKMGLKDKIGEKRRLKERMLGACSLIPKGSRAKTMKNSKELYESKCEFCRKYSKGKPIAVCPHEVHDLNTGKTVIKTKAFCRSKPEIFVTKTVKVLRKQVKELGRRITKRNGTGYKTKNQLLKYIENHKK